MRALIAAAVAVLVMVLAVSLAKGRFERVRASPPPPTFDQCLKQGARTPEQCFADSHGTKRLACFQSALRNGVGPESAEWQCMRMPEFDMVLAQCRAAGRSARQCEEDIWNPRPL